MVAATVKSYADLMGRTLAVDALSTGYYVVLMGMLLRGGLGGRRLRAGRRRRSREPSRRPAAGRPPAPC